MKHLILLTVLASLFSLSAFAEGQTETECPMMKQQSRGINPKVNLESLKKPITVETSKGKGA